MVATNVSKNVFSQPNPFNQVDQLTAAMGTPFQQYLAANALNDPYVQASRLQNDGANARSIIGGEYGLAGQGMDLLGLLTRDRNAYGSALGTQGLGLFGDLTGQWWQSALDRGGINQDQLAEQARQADLESQLGMQGLLAQLLGGEQSGRWGLDQTRQQGYNDALTTDMGNQANLAGLDQTNQLNWQLGLADLLGSDTASQAGLAGTGLAGVLQNQGIDLSNRANLAGQELQAGAGLLGGYNSDLAGLIGGNNANASSMFNNMFGTNTGANVASMNAGLQAYLQDAQLAADAEKTRSGREYARSILGEDFTLASLLGGSSFGRPRGFVDTGSGAYAQFPRMVGG